MRLMLSVDQSSREMPAHSKTIPRTTMSALHFIAFCCPALPRTTRRQRSAQVCITMRKAKRKPGPKGAQLPKESEDRIESLASKYGIRPPQPGDQLDQKFNTPSSTANDKQPSPSAYQRLAATFGVETLDAAERVLVIALGVMLVAFLVSGIAISSEAFFKASGKEVPENFDALLVTLEQAFTPTVLIFLALSSVFGLYKQSQLSSGATSYSALNKDDKNN